MTTITLTATITSNIIKGGGAQIPPSNLTAPLISGSAVVGQTLSVSDGTWAGSPAPTFSYQWKRNGSNIGGAIGNTYTLNQADATKVITCEVTATNIAGSASALSSNSLTILDADANAFITAANITNATQITAINVLTNDLKGYNIWSKMKAIYPFVGGTASTHKWNLKDPRDLDAAFRLVFNGGWTHSSTGALPNGTNGYADTFLTPSVSLLLNNSHISSYSRTSTANTNDGLIGAYTSQAPNDFGLRILKVGSNYYAENNNIFTNAAFTYSNHNGYYINSRILSTTYKTYRNNSIISTKSINSNGLAINKILLGANSDGALITYYSIREQAFATIGDGLTDTDATNLSWITEQYQTTLGRSVNPWYNNGNLLLDNYPSAAVAYSVRKLRNYYIGAAIRVRRSSDNAEQDIFFDSTGNLDTVSLLSFVGAGNGFVTTWYDQSGNGNNVTQTTAASQFRIVNAGVIYSINGKPHLYTNNNQLMLSNAFLNPDINNGSTIFNVYQHVFQLSSSFNVNCIYSIGNGSTNTQRLSQLSVAGALNNPIDYVASAQGTNSVLSKAFTSGHKLFTQLIKNNNNKIFINSNLENFDSNTLLTFTNTPYVVCLNRFQFATHGFSNSYIAEFIVYNNDQSANISAINTNINSYFNIYP